MSWFSSSTDPMANPRFEGTAKRSKGTPTYLVFATAAHDIPHPIDRLQHRLRRQVRVVSTT